MASMEQVNVGRPERLLPPGKPAQVTQTSVWGWPWTCLRQWCMHLARVPLSARPALNRRGES
jgi:hypothetical protein